VPDDTDANDYDYMYGSLNGRGLNHALLEMWPIKFLEEIPLKDAATTSDSTTACKAESPNMGFGIYVFRSVTETRVSR
jgi:hypothetical protein